MVHLYWAVKCANCDIDLLLEDLGPYDWDSGLLPVLEEPKFAEPFEIPCETCGQTRTYTRIQLILLRQESIVRKVS
jgi:hypothetical protein